MMPVGLALTLPRKPWWVVSLLLVGLALAASPILAVAVITNSIPGG